MSHYWKMGIKYICGELDSGKLINLLLVMQVETELREGWRMGSDLRLSSGNYVLGEREFDNKSRMVTYPLRKLEDPPPLPL